VTEELFDVVDENDRPTGRKMNKPAVHSDGTLHRCIAVYVFDDDGNLFIQNHHSGLYDHTVGGHVSAGEDYLPAAIRETKEEIGIKNAKLKTVATSLYSDEMFNPAKQKTEQRHMFGIFEYDAPRGWQFEPNEEVESLFKQSLEKTIEQMGTDPGKFTPGFINTMAKFIEVKNLPYKFDLNRARENWGKLVNLQ
jgi:isopentenyl-diphosphate delta-isomerase